MKGTSLFRYIHPEDLPSVKTIFKKAADEKKKFKMECRMCRAQGDYIWIESLGNTIQEKPDACAICIIGSRDIDIRKEKEEKLKLASFVDSLTGLYNRRFFYEIIAQEASKAKRLNYSICLISIDMNDFKKVNDLYGHIAGDQLLIDFAELTQNILRKNVDYAFRFGGDEFVILLIGSEQKDAEKVMARLNAGIKEFTDIVTLAYGIVEINAGDFFDPDYFVNAADKIMYEHKQQMKGIK
ncbi:MAG: sensor domain-containing diguanylate cyclase [Syntrophomonadaceae bacterium]|nr:sensor domain-containing diguanylate cyclase [Syntrophomonadaceae bacterium]